jgi:inner membrane protein
MAVAAVQDLDTIAFSFGIPYSHPFGHRGFSHSLLFAAALSLLVSLSLFPHLKRFSRRWFALLLLTFVAAASHGLLDAATDAGLGIGLLLPFSDERIFYSFRPIKTSAINPLAMLEKRTLAVLWSEVIWIWLPLAGLSFLLQLFRRARRSRAGSG